MSEQRASVWKHIGPKRRPSVLRPTATREGLAVSPVPPAPCFRNTPLRYKGSRAKTACIHGRWAEAHGLSGCWVSKGLGIHGSHLPSQVRVCSGHSD